MQQQPPDQTSSLNTVKQHALSRADLDTFDGSPSKLRKPDADAMSGVDASEEKSDTKPNTEEVTAPAFICLHFSKAMQIETALKALSTYLAIDNAKMIGAINGDLTYSKANGKEFVIHFIAGTQANSVFNRIVKMKDKGAPPNFRILHRAASQETETHAVALFITLGRNVEPDDVAAAIAKITKIDQPLIAVRRGQQQSLDPKTKMFYIVTVPASSFNDACGLYVVVPTAAGTFAGVLAPAVKWQYENDFRRFRCTIITEANFDSLKFVQELEKVLGDKVSFWDRGRKDSGEPTSTVSIAVPSNSPAATAIDLMMAELGSHEGLLPGHIRYRIAEVTRNEYEHNEARRTQGKNKPPPYKKSQLA